MKHSKSHQYSFCKILNKLIDLLYDLTLGKTIVKRSLLIESNPTQHAPHPTHLLVLNQIATYIQTLDFKINSLFDVGCGHGRAINFFSRKFSGPIYGIEVYSKIAEIARIFNVNRANVQIYIGDAACYKFKFEVDLIYMFNPFPFSIFQLFIINFGTSNFSNLILVNCSYIDQVQSLLGKNWHPKEILIRYCDIQVPCIHFHKRQNNND